MSDISKPLPRYVPTAAETALNTDIKAQQATINQRDAAVAGGTVSGLSTQEQAAVTKDGAAYLQGANRQQADEDWGIWAQGGFEAAEKAPGQTYQGRSLAEWKTQVGDADAALQVDAQREDPFKNDMRSLDPVVQKAFAKITSDVIKYFQDVRPTLAEGINGIPFGNDVDSKQAQSAYSVEGANAGHTTEQQKDEITDWAKNLNGGNAAQKAALQMFLDKVKTTDPSLHDHIEGQVKGYK